ncbi:MAG: substrate-binding domain-containing protein [Pseudomonadota bacterium]
MARSLENTSETPQNDRMAHPFPMKTIAYKAGVSLATVDRVLHGRAGVRAVTRARVAAAMAELEAEGAAGMIGGGRLTLDVVMEAPARFSDAVRRAFDAEGAAMRPARVTARFHSGERMEGRDVVDVLRAVRRRGSDGVVLKARASAEIVEAALALGAAGIPVVTYVTDLPEAARLAYVGIDNYAAGRAVAWLMGQMLAGRPCDVLTTLSSAMFSGEDAREAGFRAEIAERFQDLAVVRVSEGLGLASETRARVLQALEQNPRVGAVYSSGGANRAILDAFEAAGRDCAVFAAHDLDRANRALLAEGRLTFVLHHDLQRDARTVAQVFLRHHRMLPEDVVPAPSRFEVVTPHGWALGRSSSM